MITKNYTLSEGDVLVARTGATVGYAKRINKLHPKSIFASYLVRITPREQQYLFFVGLSICSKFFLDYIQNVAGGSGQPQANATLMTEYALIIPAKDKLHKFNKLIESVFDSEESYQIEIANLLKMKSLLLSKMAKG